MNNKQNKFYTSISKYCSEIFPYNSKQLQFVINEVGNLNGKHILDIGCATGELSFQLANSGASVIGIDINQDLLKRAKKSKAHSKLHFQFGNMLELENDFNLEQFDAVLCFGNTLVHLPTIDLISEILKGVFAVLKPGGKFLMQILNYDYILDEQVSELPLIETENIRFIRNYRFEKNNPLVRFETQLEIKREEITVSNKTSLFALKSKDLNDLLEEAGFQNVQFFSNFKQESFGGPHLPFIISCNKN